MTIHYGTPDPDETAVKHLLSLYPNPLYVLHNQRVPINARPCQQPGSLTVTAVLPDNKTVSVVQTSKGLTVNRNF